MINLFFIPINNTALMSLYKIGCKVTMISGKGMKHKITLF